MTTFTVYCKNIKSDALISLTAKADTKAIARRKVFMETRGKYKNFIVTHEVK